MQDGPRGAVILVVDDDPFPAPMMADFPVDGDWEFHSVGSAEAALDFVDQRPPDQQARALGAGAVDLLAKPQHRHELVVWVRNPLRTRSLADALAAAPAP